jgi:hypothetical protein
MVPETQHRAHANDPSARGGKRLAALLLLYAAASLVHFVHNAEFVRDYPNLPASWTRAGVYGAWVALTAIGLSGWLLSRRNAVGLLLIALYAALGIDSLGHYALAPMARHTWMMNATILAEVTAAALVLVEVLRRLAGLSPARRRRDGAT